jgi:hypothetical protein
MKLESLHDLYLAAQGVEGLKKSGYARERSHKPLPKVEKVDGLPPVTSDTQGAADDNRTDLAETDINTESGGANARPE